MKRDRPFFYHLSEGTDSDARQRFLDLEYAPGQWAIDRDLIAIHCTALEPADFGQLANGAGMVWSPLSNLLLYGETADLAAAKSAGVRIALGSDWSPSGSKNLLGKLKIARIVSDHLGGLFSNIDLVRMVTSTPAALLRWDGQVGSLAGGKKADVLILEGTTGDPYNQLISAMEHDILVVVIDGRPRHGRLGFLNLEADRQERILIGGKDYSLDLTEPSGDPLSGLSLATATAKLAYGLAHLPELALSAPLTDSAVFKLIERGAISIDFEIDEPERGFGEIQTLVCSIASQLRPLPMAPITEIDDPNFRPMLKASRNLPSFVRNAL